MKKDFQLGGEARAAKARQKAEKRVIRSSVQPSAARDLEDLPSLRAGFALLRAKDQKASNVARHRGFSCTSDPVDFVKRVVADSATSKRGHLVLAPVSEISDFAVCARIAAVLLGTYFADSEDFVNKGETAVANTTSSGKIRVRLFVSLSRTASKLHFQVCLLYFRLSPVRLGVALNYGRYPISPRSTRSRFGRNSHASTSTWAYWRPRQSEMQHLKKSGRSTCCAWDFGGAFARRATRRSAQVSRS